MEVVLFPTPRSTDGPKGGPNQRGSKGDYMLPSAVMHMDEPVELLPTPTVASAGGGQTSRSGDRKGELLLGGIAKAFKEGELLPTPGASDTRGPDYARAGRAGSGGDDLVTTVVKAEKFDRWGKYGPAIERWELVTRPAPSPTEPNRKGNPRLAPAFSEWMLGWLPGWVTDLITPHQRPKPGEISRVEALRIIGNGVVPQQAYAAISDLVGATWEK